MSILDWSIFLGLAVFVCVSLWMVERRKRKQLALEEAKWKAMVQITDELMRSVHKDSYIERSKGP